MRIALDSVQSFIWSRLGSCITCIRKAWLAVIIATAVVGFVFLADIRELWLPSGCILLCFTALWVAHLIAFAKKLSNSEADIQTTTAPITSRDMVSRRNVMPLFMRTLFLAVLVSAAPRLAVAQSISLLGCGREPCTSSCTRPAYQGGQFLGCVGCHSCGNECSDSPGSAFPNGC